MRWITFYFINPILLVNVMIFEQVVSIHYCDKFLRNWLINTSESDSITTCSHWCSVASLVPRSIASTSIPSTFSPVIFRFCPSISWPFEFLATTPMPPNLVCLHHDVSQFTLTVLGFGDVHPWATRLLGVEHLQFRQSHVLLICGLNIFTTIVIGLDIFASNVSLHRPFQMYQLVSIHRFHFHLVSHMVLELHGSYI